MQLGGHLDFLQDLHVRDNGGAQQMHAPTETTDDVQDINYRENSQIEGAQTDAGKQVLTSSNTNSTDYRGAVTAA